MSPATRSRKRAYLHEFDVQAPGLRAVERIVKLASLGAVVKRNAFLNNLVRYPPGYYQLALRTIREMDDPRSEARIHGATRLLARTLAWARQTAYGQQWGADLSAWPVLGKSAVQAKPDDFRRKGMMSVPANTSGSSGMPLRVWRGPANIAAEQAFLDHLLTPEGLSFRTARIVILRGDMPRAGADGSLPLWSYTDRKRLVLSCPGLTRKTAALYLDEVARFGPDLLWIYPTGGDQLATLCLELGRTSPVRVVLSSSEGLSAECWQRLQAAFKGRVVDYYGQTERVCISVQYRADEGWFVPAYGHVELMPEPLSPGPSVTRLARVIATGYWNDRMPLVRYDTGDRIEYPPHYGTDELAAVGVGLKPFIRVVGRASEFLWAPGGARVQALNNIPREVTNIRQAQFVQHADYSVELRVIPLPGFGPEDEAALLHACRTKIPAAVPVKVCVVESLETTLQGKTPFVIRRAVEPESVIETNLPV